jgi:hypothetical protein
LDDSTKFAAYKIYNTNHKNAVEIRTAKKIRRKTGSEML